MEGDDESVEKVKLNEDFEIFMKISIKVALVNGLHRPPSFS